jgi:hypothetical protein
MKDKKTYERRAAWLRLEEQLERQIRYSVSDQEKYTEIRRVAHGQNPDVEAHYTALIRDYREDEAVLRASLAYVRKHIVPAEKLA